MKYQIKITVEHTETGYYEGEVWTNDIDTNKKFIIDWQDGEKKLKELIDHLNATNKSVKYVYGPAPVVPEKPKQKTIWDPFDEVLLTTEDEFVGVYNNDLKKKLWESERIEKNRILRAEIKELTAKKKSMTRSEILSSKIVQQIKDKKEEIDKNNSNEVFKMQSILDDV